MTELATKGSIPASTMALRRRARPERIRLLTVPSGVGQADCLPFGLGEGFDHPSDFLADGGVDDLVLEDVCDLERIGVALLPALP